MDNTLIVVTGLGVLMVLGVGLIWILRRGKGSFRGKVGSVEVEVTSEDDLSSQMEMAQIQSENVEQEAPRGANAKMLQKKVKNGRQRIT